LHILSKWIGVTWQNRLKSIGQRQVWGCKHRWQPEPITPDLRSSDSCGDGIEERPLWPWYASCFNRCGRTGFHNRQYLVYSLAEKYNNLGH
jgi:hypothetical protein